MLVLFEKKKLMDFFFFYVNIDFGKFEKKVLCMFIIL